MEVLTGIFGCNGRTVSAELAQAKPRWRVVAQLLGVDYKGEIAGKPAPGTVIDPRIQLLIQANDAMERVGKYVRIPCGFDLTLAITELPKDGRDHKVTCSHCGTVANITRELAQKADA